MRARVPTVRALQGKTKPSRRENLSDLDCLSGDWIDMTGIRKSQGHQIPIVISKFNFPVPGYPGFPGRTVLPARFRDS